MERRTHGSQEIDVHCAGPLSVRCKIKMIYDNNVTFNFLSSIVVFDQSSLNRVNFSHRKADKVTSTSYPIIFYVRHVRFKTFKCRMSYFSDRTKIQIPVMHPRKKPSSAMKIASRPKSIDGRYHEPVVITLSLGYLEPHFSTPLIVAAKNIGVSPTALKWWAISRTV